MKTLTIPAPQAAPVSPAATGDGNDPWTEMAAVVSAFVERSGNLPGPGAEPTEDEMAGWLAVQRRAAQQGRMTEVHRSFLDARIPGWRQSRQERWNSQLTFLAETLTSGTPVKGQLKVWLKSQRRAAAAGYLSAGRQAALDSLAHGWDRPAADPELLWLGRAEDLANFVDFSGRLPASIGSSAEESGLYRWMNYQRGLARAGRITKARRKWLDKNVPGWLPDLDGREMLWSTQATAVGLFRETEGRWPSVGAPAERTLARWLGTQRASARAGRLCASRLETLDTVAAGWLRVKQRV
ncbi:helicase associated domain-containing protein [Arthrobacter terrae]|uniref:helicase associated domain-containing protein n=1 Tax=Arthrobacter terrae TaxID=2935737 RepID=UPI0028B24481|nr:helicase associated domain-containing protein [Arthrobacter terrae]